MPTPTGRVWVPGTIPLSGLGHLEVMPDGTGRLSLLRSVSARGGYHVAEPGPILRSARRAIRDDAHVAMVSKKLTGLTVLAWTESGKREPRRQCDLVVERLGVLAGQ